MAESKRQLSGRSSWRWISGCLGLFVVPTQTQCCWKQALVHSLVLLSHQPQTVDSFTNGIFQREILADSIPCGELHSVWSAPTQYTLVIVNLHIQTIWRMNPCMNGPIPINTQFQQEGTHNPHKGHSWSTQLRDCVTGSHRTPTTEGHPTENGNHSKYTSYIQTNTKRQSWEDKETYT